MYGRARLRGLVFAELVRYMRRVRRWPIDEIGGGVGKERAQGRAGRLIEAQGFNGLKHRLQPGIALPLPDGKAAMRLAQAHRPTALHVLAWAAKELDKERRQRFGRTGDGG